MATAILTLTDTEDGQISIKLEFDPPADGNAQATLAQASALEMIHLFTQAQGAA